MEADMQKWEYMMKKMSRYSSEKELNELGKDGWELVALIPEYDSELSGEFGRFVLDPDDVYAYLKRQLSN
jgi:hypothetical protein